MLHISSICPVMLDRNCYSVPAAFAGRAMSVRSTAIEVSVVADGAVIARTCVPLVRDSWNYLPPLERKLSALRNGVPFRD